jgi:hypothetical protein
MKTQIPAFFVEEHHEALLAFSRACCEGFLCPVGNILLHVDHHLDISDCRLRSPLQISRIEAVRAAVYEELGIGNFLTPACWYGLFAEVVWLTRAAAQPMDCIRLFSADGLTIYCQPPLDAEERQVPLLLADAGDSLGADDRSVVLDIDLDYFDADDEGGHFRELEITADCYREICSNPYHKLRLLTGGFEQLEVRQGRHYVRIAYPYQQPPAATSEDIDRRIKEFMAFLERNRVVPSMVVISRSRHSGFVRLGIAQEIEERLLCGLRPHYDLAFRSSS